MKKLAVSFIYGMAVMLNATEQIQPIVLPSPPSQQWQAYLNNTTTVTCFFNYSSNSGYSMVVSARWNNGTTIDKINEQKNNGFNCTDLKEYGDLEYIECSFVVEPQHENLTWECILTELEGGTHIDSHNSTIVNSTTLTIVPEFEPPRTANATEDTTNTGQNETPVQQRVIGGSVGGIMAIMMIGVFISMILGIIIYELKFRKKKRVKQAANDSISSTRKFELSNSNAEAQAQQDSSFVNL